MNEDNATYGSDFSRVFRHELAAIQDRRRSQRIEALTRLRGRGDYSHRAVHWAVTAAEQEAGLAERAFEAADKAIKLTDLARQVSRIVGAMAQNGVETTRRKVVEKVLEACRQLCTPKEQNTPDEQRRIRSAHDTASETASFHREDDSKTRLQENVQRAVKLLEEIVQKLDRQTDNRREQDATNTREAVHEAGRKVIHAARQFLRHALPTRDRARKDDGTIEAAQQKVGISQTATQEASAAALNARDMGGRIRWAAALNTAAGKVGAARAMADLLDDARQTAQPMAAAEEALEAVTAANAALWEAIKEYKRITQHLYGTEEEHKETNQNQDESVPSRIRWIGSQRSALSNFIKENQSQQAALLSSKFEKLKELLKEADETCGKKSIEAFADLDSPQNDDGEREARCTELTRLLNDFFQPRKQGDGEPQESPIGYAGCTKEYVNKAIKKLSEQAKQAAGWAWRAEQAAAEALQEVDSVLDGLPLPAVTPTTNSEGTAAQPTATTDPLAEKSDLEEARVQALNLELVGLAFSGGGIRSATFGLGVLQALGQLELLRFFDYLSTVSGGGYIGSWLAAWVYRERSLTNVEMQLDPSRVVQAKAKRIVKQEEESTQDSSYRLPPDALDEEPEPINHLRAFSRYLTPRPGIFSADTWAFISIYLRNLLINLAVLLPWTLAVVLLSRLLIWAFTLRHDFLVGWGVWGVVFLFAGIAVWLGFWLYDQRSRVNEAAQDPTKQAEGADRVTARGGTRLLVGVMVMTVAGSWLFSYSPGTDGLVARLSGSEAVSKKIPLRHPFYSELNDETLIPQLPTYGSKFTLLCVLATVILSLISGLFLRKDVVDILLRKSKESVWRYSWRLLLFDAVLGLGFGLCLSLALQQVIWRLGTDSAAIVAFGPPAVLLALILADYMEMLLVGKLMDELEREWRSRLGAVLFMLAASWLLFFGTTLYLPWALEQITDHPDKRKAVYSAAAAAWVTISTLSGWAGRWLQAGTATRRALPWLQILVLVGPAIFLIGLLAAVAMLVPLLPPYPAQGVLPAQGTLDPLNIACDPTANAGMKWLGYLLLSCSLIVLLRNTVDVNRNSMHMFYANRLIRCYLGASRRKRRWRWRVSETIRRNGSTYWLWGPGNGGAPTNADSPTNVDPKDGRIARREPTFTDFDPSDDLLLQDLVAVGPDGEQATTTVAEANNGYRGPYPLLNTTLNLVAGSELSLQDRKADSFVLTPDFCGSKMTGYARLLPLDEEITAGKGHITLGRAMTISGAAVDPNMGVIQSAPLTALMTVLNTRLGWWMQNPAWFRERWDGSGPKVGSLVIRELFGQTNDKSKFIHLSDGGHFENLGVYELIRRRCRFIVVADVTTDRHAASDNLGNLLRLIRTDFGISIDLDTGALAEEANGLARWHCGIGLIHYEDVDPRAVSGLLIYLRASLTGDEPPDVRQYADTCPPFPHQTTLDQFFSEGQLESYRALGFHIAREVFAASAERLNRDGCDPLTVQSEVRDFFARVRRRWFPSPPGSEQNFPATARLYMDVEKNLRTGDKLKRLRQELYRELPDVPEKSVRRSLLSPPIGLSLLPGPQESSDPSTELFMVTEILQVMELAWFGMKLDDYHAHPLNRGWMNLFRRWTNSPTFHGYWPLLRGEFSQEFVSFCEAALNMAATDVKRERLEAGANFQTWLTALQEMDLEFENEWDSERDRLRWLTTGRYLRDAVATAKAFAVRLGLVKPLVWLPSFQYGQARSQRRICGLFCAGPSFRGAVTELEFLVWLRGPYRNLGAARSCMEPILKDIWKALRHKPAAKDKPFRLYVYYPDAGVNRAERLEQSMWRSFFFDYGFRSVEPEDSGNFPGVIALARELR